MAYFNNTNDPNFYSTSSVPCEFEAYPFLDQTATEELDTQARNTLADHWSVTGQLGPMVGSPTSFWATNSYESAASATSYATRTDGDCQSSYFGNYWPAVGQQTQSYHSDFLSQGDSFANTVASEASTVVPTPSGVPLGYWGASQSGPSASMFYTQNVESSYNHSTGPTRTGLISTGRFQPYGMSRTHPNEYGNAEAGPSTLVPPPIQYIGPPTPQPSGGTTETTADAGNHPITEEIKVPRQATKRIKHPRGQGPLRKHRIQMQEGARRLCAWARGQAGLKEAPTFNRALAIAAGIIPEIRGLESLEPRLLVGQSKRTAAGSRNADGEFQRRNTERELFQEISRYYPLERDEVAWARPSLLLRVLKDLEALPPPSGPSNGSPP